jgi:hypothetical protein
LLVGLAAESMTMTSLRRRAMRLELEWELMRLEMIIELATATAERAAASKLALEAELLALLVGDASHPSK